MVEDSEKAKMAETLVETTKVNISLGKPRTLSVYNDSALHHFIDEESWLFLMFVVLNQHFWPDLPLNGVKIAATSVLNI